jgi:hypothetical protein
MERLNALLQRAWRNPIRVKSDYARDNADVIGMAASLQLITTKVGQAKFASAWHITIKGQSWLAEQDN